jgi:hypothetical protein
MKDIDEIIVDLEKTFVGKPISKETPSILIERVKFDKERNKFICVNYEHDYPRVIISSLEDCAKDLEISLDPLYNQ